MFHNIIHNVFRDNADYDELVNDLYLHLMDKDGRRLRSFGQDDADSDDNDQPIAYALIKWLKTTAWRFFADKAEREQSVEERRKIVRGEDGTEMGVDVEDKSNRDPAIDIDAEIFFDMIKLERDREVLKKYFVEDLEPDEISEKLGISKAKLYNVKKRALNRLQQAARHATSGESLCAVICEQYALDVFGIHRTLEALHALSAEKGWLTPTGVALENIGALCRESGLNVAAKADGNLSELAAAIDGGCQIIAAIDGGELTGNQLEEEIEDTFCGRISDHCVIVLAIEAHTVTLYDPAFGCTPLSVSTNHFLDAWDDSSHFYVAIGGSR